MKINRLMVSYILAFFATIILAFMLLMLNLQEKVKAQTTCAGPAIFSDIGVYDPRWDSGSNVKVYFKQGDFTSGQRDTMKEAFEAWESRRVSNCSGVTFDDSAYAERVDQPTTVQAGSYVWITTAAGGSGVNTISNPRQ